MHFRKPQIDHREDSQLNVASMIDVVFLLLIFFITTASLALPESKLTPAIQTSNADAQSQSADFSPQVLRVEPHGGRAVFRLGGRTFTERADLIAILRELPKELGIFVEVSDAVSVEAAVMALQCCHDAGFEKVTYVPESR